jgi:hypothetical protein
LGEAEGKADNSNVIVCLGGHINYSRGLRHGGNIEHRVWASVCLETVTGTKEEACFQQNEEEDATDEEDEADCSGAGAVVMAVNSLISVQE